MIARFSFFVTLALAAVTVQAAPFGYATNYLGQLWRIDLQSPAGVQIGNLGFAAQGLCQTSAGTLYATDNSGNFYDVTSGSPTLLSNIGPVSVGSMDSDGTTIWGYDNNSQRMFQYNPGTLTVMQISPVLGIPNLEALVIDSAGNFLFTSKVSSLVDRFGMVNSTTWGVSVINPNMGLADNCEALDFLADGNLYGAVLGDTRYQIDPNTGTAISGFYSGVHRDWADMTSLPAAVPEPGTLVLVGLAVVGLVRRKRSAG